MEILPEFRVTLTRLKEGETALPNAGKAYEWQGQRTKLGGSPDWVQGDETPKCPDGKEPMTFVAQLIGRRLLGVTM